MAPEGTQVDKVYKALKRKGMSKGKAARIAQANTGLALATGKPPKKKKKRTRTEMWIDKRNKEKK